MQHPMKGLRNQHSTAAAANPRGATERSARRSAWRSVSGGLTLIELAVAILVLALGSLAALRATDQSRLAIGGEMPRLLTRIAARNRAEELQILGATAPSLSTEIRMGPHLIQLQTQREATAGGLIKTSVTARADSGEQTQLILYLSPEPRQ